MPGGCPSNAPGVLPGSRPHFVLKGAYEGTASVGRSPHRAGTDPPDDVTAGSQVVPGPAAHHQVDLLAAVPVGELDGWALRIRQVAIAPLLQRDQHRVQV